MYFNTLTTIISFVSLHKSNGFIHYPSFTSNKSLEQRSRTSSSSPITRKLKHLRLSSNNEVERLLQQAAKIRKELAALEGKSVQQVEEEASLKKQTLRQSQIDQEKTQEDEKSSPKSSSKRQQVTYVPESREEQTRQAALAIERAFQDGITRQTIRLALIVENGSLSDDEEEWPGGSKQIYREAGRPLTEALLTEVRAIATNLQTEEEKNLSKAGHLPPQITAQDILDFDGSAILTAQAQAGPSGDVQALVFANTDVTYLKNVKEISKNIGEDRLFLLINPYWKNIESWGFNILAPQGKRLAQETLFDNPNGGYKETYVINRFSVRGENCLALKAYPYDWQLFAYLEDYSLGAPVLTPIRLGTCTEAPTTALITELLNERKEFKLNKTMRSLKNNNMF